MPFGISVWELMILLIVLLLIFGAKRLPEMGRSLGKGMREFKDSVSGVTDVKEAISGVNEVRTAMTPSNLAGAFVPGVKDVQESVAAAKSVANPLAGEAAASEGAAASAPAAAKPAAE